MEKCGKHYARKHCDNCIKCYEVARIIVSPEYYEASKYHGDKICRGTEESEHYLAYPESDYAERVLTLATARKLVPGVANCVCYKANEEKQCNYCYYIRYKLIGKGRAVLSLTVFILLYVFILFSCFRRIVFLIFNVCLSLCCHFYLPLTFIYRK